MIRLYILLFKGANLFKKHNFIILLIFTGFLNTAIADDAEQSEDEEALCKNDMVACYGIADAGQNENVINPSSDGQVYGIGEAPACHPEAYICMPATTDCSRIIVGQDEKLNYVRGSGEPNFARPQVDYCYPYNYADKKTMFPNPDWKREVDRV